MLIPARPMKSGDCREPATPASGRAVAHAGRRPFAREIFGEIMHGGFRRRVGEHARQRRKPGRRAEVDDAAGFLLDEVLAKHLAGQHDAFQVHVDDAVELIFGNVEERRRRIDARAVHQNIHATKFLQNIREQLLQRCLGSRFARKEFSVAAALGDGIQTRLSLGRIAANERHRRARDGDAFGHFAAQHARAADDDRHFAFE